MSNHLQSNKEHGSEIVTQVLTEWDIYEREPGPFNSLTKLIHNPTLSSLEKNNSVPPHSSLLHMSLPPHYTYISNSLCKNHKIQMPMGVQVLFIPLW